MSTFEHIYLYTGGQDVALVADRIAGAIGGRVSHDRGAVIVSRAMRSVPDGGVGGEVMANMFYENPPDPANPSLIDLYDISYNVWCTPRPDEFQEREAKWIFSEIIEKLDWPAVLTHGDGDLLASAWSPKLGRRDFPQGTTPDEGDQVLWAPYADPATLVGSPEG